MKKLILTATALVLMSGTQGSVQAQEIVSYLVPGFTTEDRTGVFNVTHAEVMERAGLDMPLKYYPANRSYALFNSNNAKGLVPVPLESIPQGLIKDPDVLATKPFIMAMLYAVVRKEDKVPTTFEELHGKRVGVTDGYIYDTDFIRNKEIDIEWGRGPDASLRKLVAGRVDVAIIEGGAIRAVIPEIGPEKLNYTPDETLMRLPVAYVFQNTPEGKEMRDKVSAAITSLKDDGTLAKRFGPAAP